MQTHGTCALRIQVHTQATLVVRIVELVDFDGLSGVVSEHVKPKGVPVLRSPYARKTFLLQKAVECDR